MHSVKPFGPLMQQVIVFVSVSHNFTQCVGSVANYDCRVGRRFTFSNGQRWWWFSDLSAVTVKELLVPTVSNLLRDSDSLDPAHKEALEVILKERSVNRLESISKVMAMSTMGSIFGEGGFLSKKEPGEDMPSPTLQSESGMLKRMMRNNYGGNIFSRSSGTPEH